MLVEEWKLRRRRKGEGKMEEEMGKEIASEEEMA